MSNTIKTLLIGLVLGALLGAIMVYTLAPSVQDKDTGISIDSEANDAPLYWVAPMDPNFKRDKPGKSPMGMDLVPVYADEAAQGSPGTVKINPVIVNNLGVKTAKVQAMMPKSTLNTFGQVHFAQNKIVHIHPRVEGWIESLNVRTEGEFVEQGQPLYSLYAPDLVNAQEELLIALEQGNKGLINAAQSRLRALNAPDSLIKDIRKTRKVERTITFFAPQSGFISELNIQEGFYVKPSTTMLAIANLDEVWILADIFANDLSKVELGQTALIQSDYLPKRDIAAQVDYIYPTLDDKTRTAKARLLLPNPDLQLKPEMFVNVAINLANQTSEKLILVPKQAVIRTGDSDRVVLAQGEGEFKSINVELGKVFDEFFEVSSGVQEGDEIVVSAQFLLDSESSIDSDFMRMGSASNSIHDNSVNQEAADLLEKNDELSAWTQAIVNEVTPDERMVNLTHGPLDAFKMMGMTMNFMVDDAIDMSKFKVGMEVHVEIVKTTLGMYAVKTAHFMDEGGHGK